jgi:peptide/nickel transport system substrate-binding protein
MADDLDPDAIGQAREDSELQVVETPGMVIYYLALHSEGQPEVAGILEDVRVRQAVAYSIDYDGIVEELQGGAAVRPASMIAIGMLGADKLQETAYVEDLDKAKELLAEAGAEDGELTLSYRANPDTEIYVAKLKADIERSGLSVTLAPGDPTNVLQDYREAKLQAVFLQWGPDYPDVHTNAFPFGGVEDVAPSLRMSYVNEDNVPLLEQAIQELDPVKREDLYVQVGENMIEDAVFIPIYQPVSQEAVKSTVTGVTLSTVWFYLLDRFAPA